MSGGSRNEVILVAAAKKPDAKQHAGGVITATSLLLESAFSSYFKVHVIDSTAVAHPPERLRLKVRKGVNRLRQFIWVCIKGRPRAVLVWAAGGFSLYEKLLLCAVARLFGIRSLMLYVDSIYMARIEGSRFRWLHRLLFSIPDVLVCRSQTWVDRYRALGMPAARCAIVKNWIAPEKYMPCRTRQSPGRDVVFLYVGWLIREKGTRELAEAIALVSPKLLDARWIIVGGGKEEEFLRAFTASKGLEQRVEITGWKNPSELFEYYRRASILVLPSYGEGFPYAIIEAMCSGLPIITTPVGGIPGIFRDGEHGLFVPPKDASALAQAMLRLAEDHRLRDEISRNVIRYVEQNHDIKVIWQQLAHLLEGRPVSGQAA